MFDLNSFVIDRPVRGIMRDSATGELLWMVNQIEDPSITMSSESTDAVDAIGIPIMSFERSKTCEFSASNSLLDLGLLAAQSGNVKKVADTDNTIEVTTIEEIEWVAGTDVVLKHEPIGTSGAEIPFIYALNGDGTYGTKYVVGAAAGEGVYKVVAATKKITPPTDVTTKARALVVYKYTADGTENNGAVQVAADAVNFPKAGRFMLEVLGADTCNISTKYYGYLEFPQAKLTSDFDLTLTTDGKHPFTIRCMQEYCDAEKKLFTLTVPEA